MTAPRPDIVVAIPARDEADLLPICLDAIAAQQGIDMARVAVVVSANNCRDDTAARARAMSLPCAVHVVEVALPPERAHAGGARRHAMDAAADICAEDGILLTTDADGRADPDWLAGYAAAFAPGIAAVAGRVSADWDELSQFPADVLEIGAIEWEYQNLAAEFETRCDPQPHDPWPSHNQTCGANAGITRAWYHRIGGLPLLRTGEDGAMFAEVWQRDGLIRHDRRPHVTVSARLEGRAQGGMADALAARHGDDYLCDDLLEPAADLERRARLRLAARIAFGEGRLVRWAAASGVDPALAAEAGDSPHFGAAWRHLEANWPLLIKRRIAARDMPAELAAIRAALARTEPERTAP